MKRQYQKPYIVIESFALAEHVAACGTKTVGTGNAFGKPNHWSEKSDCEFVLNDGVTTLFVDPDQCSMITDPDNMIIGCYNTPDGTNSIFAS